MTEILPFDVLLGRGKLVHHHMGNVVYRNEVKERSGEFQVQSSLARHRIARDVVENVHRRGGRFLRPIVPGDASQWETCPYQLALSKVKQALRDVMRLGSLRTSSSSSDVHTRKGGDLQGTQPEPSGDLDSAASCVARLVLAPAEGPSTLGLTRIACSTEIDGGRSNEHGPRRSEELPQSNLMGPQGHQIEPFSGEYHLRPTIASLQHSIQHRRHELANYVIPRSRQGPEAQTSVPQAVRFSTSVLPHMASLRSQNDSSGSSIYANNRGSWHSISSTPPADPGQQPSPLLPGRLSQPLDSEMSELLRRLRDGV